MKFFYLTDNLEQVKELQNENYIIGGVLVPFCKIEEDSKLADLLRQIKDGGTEVMISPNVDCRGRKIIRKQEELVELWNRYYSWLINNKNSYNYAVEIDAVRRVNKKVIDEWREALYNAGINFVLVLYFVRESVNRDIEYWLSKGVNYIGVKGFRNDRWWRNRIKTLKARGVKFHIFDFDIKSVGRSSDVLKAVYSVTIGNRLKKEVVRYVSGGKLGFYKAKQYYGEYKKAMAESFVVNLLFSGLELAKMIDNYDSRLFMWQNIEELEKWRKEINGERVFVRGAKLWRKGDSVFCGDCPLRERCKFAGRKDDVCVYLPIKKYMSRNKEVIIEKLQDEIAKDVVLYLRGRMLGGAVEYLERKLLREFELLYTLKSGKSLYRSVKIVKLFGEDKVEEALRSVRVFFGSRLAEKLKSKL
jgi:hypothetical protein